MALVRWDPFSELDNLHKQVNSLFNDAFGSIHGESLLTAATDVYSDDKSLTIEAHLPHFNEDEINVQQHEGELEIKAEHHEKDEKKGRKYLVHESASQYYRRFSLPKNADANAIQASFDKGVLKITVPFKELPAPKRIAIGSGDKSKK